MNWHDAFDAQMALWRWYRTDDGARWLWASYNVNSTELNASTGQMLRDLYESEEGKVLDADPIFVSADMCDLIDHASQEFKPEALLETDLITPRGFLLFEKPFVIPDRFDTPVALQGISWSRIFTGDDAQALEVDLRDVARSQGWNPNNRGAVAMEDYLLGKGVTVRGVTITLYAATKTEALPESISAAAVPKIIPMHLTPWWYDMDFPGNEVDENGKTTGAEWWWRIAQTTFRLMQQKIAHRSLDLPPRAMRREAKRYSYPDDREVVVVRLRHEAGPSKEPTGESANYSHRFIVSGHWRDQWYPSINSHRQIWVSPYVKGDPGLPLIVRPRRAFQWNR